MMKNYEYELKSVENLYKYLSKVNEDEYDEYDEYYEDDR